MTRYIIVNEKGADNFTHSIYEEGEKGLLIARCNQNGRYNWQTQAIKYGLENYKIGKKTKP